MAYWCDRQTGTIFKRALSGGTNEVVIAGMNAPHGIALDVEAEKLYWADTGGRAGGPMDTSARRIARCNFDGTEYETVSSPGVNSTPWDLALDTSISTYADWRARFFSTNTPSAGPDDDADGDGAPNLVEYAFGTNPRKSQNAPRIIAEGAAMKYLRQHVSAFEYRAEVSSDLAEWHYNGDTSGFTWTTNTGTVPVSPEYDWNTVTGGPAFAGVSQGFYRVKATMP